jgi:two-component system, NtrC family, response regulator AtoC
MPHVLIVDDEAAFRQMLEAAVAAAGFAARTAPNGERALELAASDPPALVFLDLNMGSRAMSGLEALEAFRARHPEVPVVLVTAFGDVQTAVAAMKSGALDFLEKPIDLDDVRRILGAALGPDDAAAADSVAVAPVFGGIATASPAMHAAVDLLAAAAESDAPVLITGESGTGKELAAAFVHDRSARCGGPFVKVNCAAIPSGLLEAEMFGAAAGAFTGATRAREGRFEAAEGGTLLLDEIAEMDAGLQAKLLRAIQEREYEPVGGVRPRRADVRIVASTNRPIEAAIRSGAFREDLYFRLNVFEIALPPLRERREDLLPLARHFTRELAEDRPRRLAAETEAALEAHTWPGNVRELRNTIERAVILARGGVVHPEHLPPNVTAAAPGAAVPRGAASSPPRAGTNVHEMERRLIVETLARTAGNRTRAAESLGMSRRALLYKLKRYGIDG